MTSTGVVEAPFKAELLRDGPLRCLALVQTETKTTTAQGSVNVDLTGLWDEAEAPSSADPEDAVQCYYDYGDTVRQGVAIITKSGEVTLRSLFANSASAYWIEEGDIPAAQNVKFHSLIYYWLVNVV